MPEDSRFPGKGVSGMSPPASVGADAGITVPQGVLVTLPTLESTNHLDYNDDG